MRLSIFVLSLAFAGAPLFAADPPAPAAPETAGQKPEPPPAPAPAAPVGRVMMKGFTKMSGMVEAVGQEKADAHNKAVDDFNATRDQAEAQARKTAKSEGEVIDSVRKNPGVVAKLSVASAIVADDRVPAAAREQVATALIAADQPGEAARLSEKTLAREPDNRDALNNLSQARFSLGQYRDAIENATRLAQKDPSSESAYTTRALSLYYSGEYLKAAEDAKRALALNKNNDIALSTLRMAESRMPPASLKLDAIAAAQAANIKAEYQASLDQRNQVEAEATHAAAGTAGGQTAAKIASDEHWEAVAKASEDIAANPGSAQAWYLRAVARNRTGEHDQAISDATQALKLAPGYAQAYDARAKALFGQGRWQEARQDATESIRLDPTNAYAFATRARAFEKLGEYPAMIADLQQAARLNRQFEPEYQQAAARRALPPPPAGGAGPSTPPSRPAESDGRPSWLLTAFTVIGGCLIAFGLLHFVSAQWNRKITTALHRLEEARASLTPPLQDISGISPHFQVVRVIGKGGMGVVYEAMDKGLNRRVALKKMREEIRVDPRERDRFLQEARTVAALHHPNIVDIHAIVEEGSELCLVFEHVSGRTVEQLLEVKKRLSLPEVRQILRGVCQALDYAHKRGVIHRDLKPSNIMLTDDSEVKVMDFGIARHAKDALSRMTVTNTIAGTPPYMAPEADQGVVRPETDVYGLGACLYEMLTGERPFSNQATTSAKLAMSYQKPTRLRRDLPAAVDALIDAALQPDPDKRISSAGQFLSQLEAAFSVPAA